MIARSGTPDAQPPADGYVKYRAEFMDAPAPRSPLLPALISVRAALYDLALIGVYPNGIGYGNVSVRAENGAGFIISGTATGGARVLAPEDYCLVTDFDIDANLVRERGRVRASSESMSHGAIYRACPSARCVLHVHSRAIFDAMLSGGFPTTPPGAVYGTPEMARAVMSAAAGKADGALVMAGHDEGVLVWGAAVEDAFARVKTLYDAYV
jgi:ribulose-5-phosphate 4-epimerase/fuculose-1-phosphate aldolase